MISVEIKGKTREFAANFKGEHPLNINDSEELTAQMIGDVEAIQAAYGDIVAAKLAKSLAERDDFVSVGDRWFIKSLLADVNIGHLHLAEAVLEVAGGGPLTTAEILPHLELDPGIDIEIQDFSLTRQLMMDGRFDEVSSHDPLTWFLRRMEPEGIQTIPERLAYTPIPYDRKLLTPQQLLLEQELDDPGLRDPRRGVGAEAAARA